MRKLRRVVILLVVLSLLVAVSASVSADKPAGKGNKGKPADKGKPPKKEKEKNKPAPAVHVPPGQAKRQQDMAEATPEPDASPLITPEPTPAFTLEPTPFPSSEESLVGDFMCLELATARDLLEDEGLLVGATYPDPPPGETWVVQDQLPKPGESVPVGTKVDLMLADPQEPCPPG